MDRVFKIDYDRLDQVQEMVGSAARIGDDIRQEFKNAGDPQSFNSDNIGFYRSFYNELLADLNDLYDELGDDLEGNSASKRELRRRMESHKEWLVDMAKQARKLFYTLQKDVDNETDEFLEPLLDDAKEVWERVKEAHGLLKKAVQDPSRRAGNEV